MRARVREGAITLLAVLFYPVTLALGVAMVVRRASRREPLMRRGDAGWLARKALVLLGATLSVWLFFALLLAFASIFVSIPNI